MDKQAAVFKQDKFFEYFLPAVGKSLVMRGADMC